MSEYKNKRIESLGDEIDTLDYDEILNTNATQEEIDEMRNKLDGIIL